MIRVTYCRYCEGWLSNFDAAQDLTWGNLSGPGHWNDIDMYIFLSLSKLRLTILLAAVPNLGPSARPLALLRLGFICMCVVARQADRWVQ